MNLIRRSLLALLPLVLAACGGGGGDSISGSAPGGVRTGVFVDAPVSGLEYAAPSFSGLTATDGGFRYREGETLTFALGNIVFGSAAGAPVITPFSLVPGANLALSAAQNPAAVTNIARLLATLDSDGDPRNGIQIAASVRTRAATAPALNFNQSIANFAAPGGAAQQFIQNAAPAATNGQFKPVAEVQAELDKTRNEIRANGAPNRLPLALAANDFAVDEGAVVSLTANGSDPDGQVIAYEWTQQAGSPVTISNRDQATASFTAPAVSGNQTLIFNVVAIDNAMGRSLPDSVTVTVRDLGGNQPPVAIAGTDQTVDAGAAVTLSGAASSDADGSIASFQWTQLSGPMVTLAGANTATATFTAPSPAMQTDLTFRLTVTDDDGDTASDDIRITVRAAVVVENQPPVAVAGADQTVAEGAQVQLNGSGSSDADGNIVNFQWTQAASDAQQVTLTGANTAMASFTAPPVSQNTTLNFTLTVTDDDGAMASDSLVVVVQDNPVVATLSIADASAFEADGMMDFVVTLSAASEQAVIVDFATNDGTASAGTDYTATSGTLSFAPQETQRTIRVPVLNDGVAEPDETFTVTLSNPVNATLNRATATGTLRDSGVTQAPACPAGELCVGASKRSITPTQAHIDGVEEDRFFGGSKIQKFNLGGFGINPFQNFPDPFGQFAEALTEPASQRVYNGSFGPEDTHVRAMSIRQGNADVVVFLMIDAVGAGNVISRNLKAAVVTAAAEVGVTLNPDNIIFGQTHSHAGADLQGLWGGVPQDWINNILYKQSAAAVRAALITSEPAVLSVRQGTNNDLNNYRRPRVDPQADADGTLTLVEAQAKTGQRPIGSILQYNAHPVSINPEDHPRTPHADYIQGAMDWLENTQTGPGGVALYFNGPIADASGTGGRAGCAYPENNLSGDGAGYGSIRCRGEGMADAAQGFEPQILAPTLSVRHAQAALPVTNPAFVAAGALGAFNRYYNFTPQEVQDIPVVGDTVLATLTTEIGQITPTAETAVSRITLGGEGGLEIVTIPGEATNTFGQYIRGLKPNSRMMLLGLTQNSFGYIIPEDEFSYVEPSGDAGLIVPFTGYEEFVSLGPLTAPLLRLQAYNPLFDIPQTDPRNLPPSLTACASNPTGSACLVARLAQRVDYVQRSYAQLCRENGAPEQFCALIDPDTPLNGPCQAAGLPPEICSAFGPATPGAGAGGLPIALPQLALDALARGCDPLDGTACLFPFPSDYYTVEAEESATVKTGRRINFSPLAMPRNLAGKPVDPTEWNRNDGFSPGPMIMTVVPGLDSLTALKRTYGFAPMAPDNLVGITNPELSLQEDAPMQVFEVAEADGAVTAATPHLVWSELDVNATRFLDLRDPEPIGVTDPLVEQFSEDDLRISRTPGPQGLRTALILRPAKNFTPGKRYVVVLRKLRTATGEPIAASPLFATCRDGGETGLPPLDARCEQLRDRVFPVLSAANIPLNDDLYLAWDFTVASRENTTARLVHMRDEAFATLKNDAGQAYDCTLHSDTACTVPEYTVESVTEDGDFMRVQGAFTVPSFMVPPDASPADGGELNEALSALTSLVTVLPGLGDLFSELLPILQSGSVPPNRLFYDPTDGGVPMDPSLAPFGDGLPDRLPTGTQTARFDCRVHNEAYAPGAAPYRPSLYGHGLLGGRGEVGAGNVKQFALDHRMMFCAIDWFGFATGDVPNVATVLVDASNFPVIPDASQQGFINWMFLSRVMQHPQGLVSHSAFQKMDGTPVFDRSEIFYDGNSQGGILPGPVLAVSRDINRGVFGVPGMNYSTLLRRSVDFTPYSTPLYLSYPDELDRNLIFGLMQMLWDRSENNGYANYLTPDGALDGQDNYVLLHPAYSDHQVSMWTSDVMTRTLNAAVDEQRLLSATGNTHPDVSPYSLIPRVQYVLNRAPGSAQVIWVEPGVVDPPIDETPPEAGRDPHGYPRSQRDSQCQKSHFLRSNGFIADTVGVGGPEACADRFGLVPTRVVTLEADDDGDGIGNSMDRCPTTPPGTTVDARGCGLTEGAADDDGDGVPNRDDACPNTAEGADADEEGCATAQLDGDGDGVNDAEDLCPMIPAGEGGVNGCPFTQNASCDSQQNLAGNRSYQVVIPSDSDQVISFQVLEPTTFNCVNRANGAHPLILHGHGFGGSRSTGGFADYRNAGYTVISIDMRGFGDSSGTVRVMDPDFEGRDLIAILDWAEANLDYLAYRNEGSVMRSFAPRPAGGSEPGGINLLAGAIGSSYGGGFQLLLHAVDDKNRLDALAPDITWHDLRYSLNPGDTLKSGWDLLLTAGGEAGSYLPGLQNQDSPLDRGLDPYIKEVLARGIATGEFPREALEWFRYHSPSYWCGLNGQPTMPYAVSESAPLDPNFMLGGLAGDVPGTNEREDDLPPVDVLLSQGMRDTLFNFNDAWFNYQCLAARGGDVRLITHQSGHILQGFVPAPGPLQFQEVGGNGNCGTRNRGAATVQWFNEKLKGQAPSAQLAGTQDALCLSLADGDAVLIAADEVLAPRAAEFAPATAEYQTAPDQSASNLPQGLLAQVAYNASPGPTAVLPLLTVTDVNGLIVAGIPTADITVTTPQMLNDIACGVGSVPTLRTGCDSTVFVALGVKRSADMEWRLVDDQIMPVRGLGTQEQVHFVGVAERLAQGDQLALLAYGYHPQYLVSFSRDLTIPAVNVTVSNLKLPLYAVNNGEPNADPAATEGAFVYVAEEQAAASLLSCLQQADVASCQAAVSGLLSLADCPPDESGLNCAFNAVYDRVGVMEATAVVTNLVAQCNASPAGALCAAIRDTGGLPDALPVASESVARGSLVLTEVDNVAPSAKTIDGQIGDWTGVSTLIGGSNLYSRGEHIYTDFLFDGYGADDGDDARRLAALMALGQINSRVERVDALQQAGGDQLGVPQPAGSRSDRYGDAASLGEGLDLTEVRWAADQQNAYLLARVTRLQNPDNLVVIVLADTRAGAGMNGLDAALGTAVYDRAFVLERAGARSIDLLTGSSSGLGSGAAAVRANGNDNALEAAIPRSLIQNASGELRVVVMTAQKQPGGGFKPINLAYRGDEPVAIYNERRQALSLLAGNVDGFATTISLNDLVAGRTQAARPGPGYHERQFVSGENISNEDDNENGRLQHYGLYVPSSIATNMLGEARLTFWLHYRGGKAHSGAAWTPRLIHQLGEEQGNIVVTPRARGTSSWYTTRAHQDFFEVFADVAGTDILRQYADENLSADHGFAPQGLFDVDPSRVYLSGYSMGGYATYLFGGLYPDLFAAGYSTSGAVTQGAWTGLGPDESFCGGGTNPCFVEANGGRANAQLKYRLLENFRHVPLTIHHGTNDELALTPGALRMGERMLQLQYRYDATTFIGYEHFTQAIVDEWRDGAVYLNQFQRPENPRAVTYKVLPALVKAVNEVQRGDSNGGQPFAFNPDGAYWVDGLVVREGADGSDPTAFGQIEAESGQRPATPYLAVPRTGASADPLYLSTPILSPGNHSTPFIRHGLDWVDLPGASTLSNRFAANLLNLSAATLDAPRMGLDFAAPITGTLQSDGPASFRLRGIGADMTLCSGAAPTDVAAGDTAVLSINAGTTVLQLLPGFNADCNAVLPAVPDYGPGLLGLAARFFAELHDVVVALVSGDLGGAQTAFMTAFNHLADGFMGLPDAVDSNDPLVAVIGDDPAAFVAREVAVNRDIEAVVLTGAQLAAWSVPAAQGVPYPYPSGAGITNQGSGAEQLEPLNQIRDPLLIGEVRSAHNGAMIYPLPGSPMGVDTRRIAAYRVTDAGGFEEIPVQVDQRFPHFLANARSTFGIYSGTDEELSYDWDVERWGNPGVDPGTEDLAENCHADFSRYARGGMLHTPDPVRGLDHDDEVVFMARDAGGRAAPNTRPNDPDLDPLQGLQEIALADPLTPGVPRYVYLGLKTSGRATAFGDQPHYVQYQRDANADQWIDRSFFRNDDPEKLGSSNDNYGANHIGTVCGDANNPAGIAAAPRPSTAEGLDLNGDGVGDGDRFTRDGVTVSTDTYQWRATGRWMVREVRVTKPGEIADYGDDLIDRWKGRAFQQSPDSTVSLVGFEDEQVNWEANSTLIGERCGPVRCIREVWGADSGTNVTKTETFYRDAVASRYRVRVHPIPPDGLYTAWDYNRSAMVPTAAEATQGIEGGRYYTVLRPNGVPVDGINDDVGQIDSVTREPIAGMCLTSDGPRPAEDFGGICPLFFDAADPSFNLPLAFNNWEQVSGKGDLGSLVYVFELKGATSLGNPLVVPYYRDDACLDDGTGDDPVPRPFPGDAGYNANVKAGYSAANGGAAYDTLRCEQKQGAHGAHGVHYFFTHDTDNAFLLGKPSTEVDGEWWQIMVPTDRPQNRGAEHANVIRARLQPVVTFLPPGLPPATGEGGLTGLLTQLSADFSVFVDALTAGEPQQALTATQIAFSNLAAGLNGLLFNAPVASVAAATESLRQTPTVGTVVSGLGAVLTGATPPVVSGMRAGVAVVDMTPDVGYGTGQHGSDGTERFDGLTGGEMDPYLAHKKLGGSYGVQSRLTARAIVVEGSNGKRIALLKTDNYLAQDTLLRRVGQLLAGGSSGIGYEQILHHVTHDHNAAYNSTPAAGVFLFQDAFDARFFEAQARRMAQAIEQAAANLKPARMGAIEIRHTIFKGNVTGPAVANDGTPAGYPREYGDHGLAVMRFDDMSDPLNPRPLAAWVNWGEHPESLQGGVGLHSADFLAPLERFVERDIGAPLVFSQGDVGSAEREGDNRHCLNDAGAVIGVGLSDPACAQAGGVRRNWNRRQFTQLERNVRYLADDIKRAWNEIGALPANTMQPRKVALASNHPVNYLNAWVPGPLSHPYPSVSNCGTERTLEGDPGVPVAGLPDCSRETGGALSPGVAMVHDSLRAHGIPVPDHYDAPSFGAVEENARLKLQVIQVGEVLLASCACEAQVDLILNLESRLDAKAGEIYNGFDWACLLPQHAGDSVCEVQRGYFDAAQFPNTFPLPGNNFDATAIERMRAQVHNDARGWDAPEYVPFANTEPLDTAQIKGNFTHEEIQDIGVSGGFRLPIGIGHAGDYNGYTVSYREYMRGDHYRKALTAYGPHTADYMATRLVRMAAQLKGGPNLIPEAHDAVAQADELRMQAQSRLLGEASARAYDAWLTALPADIGPASVQQQPQPIQHFNAATFQWRGGSTQVDNPVARVQKRCTAADISNAATDLSSLWLRVNCTAAGAGSWVNFADMSGEVQTRVNLPQGVPGLLQAYAGQHAWTWTANFEAYQAFPARLGSTPLGDYRFVVRGCINDGLGAASTGAAFNCPGNAQPYQLISNPFQVSAGGVSQRGYASSFPFIQPDAGGEEICDRCSFRPWAGH